MDKNIQRGIFRIWVVITVLWIGGMGWYQYQEANKIDNNSITIALSKDSQLRIDANGISKSDENDKLTLQMKRIGIVFFPPILLLIIFPVGAWLARGFKSK